MRGAEISSREPDLNRGYAFSHALPENSTKYDPDTAWGNDSPKSWEHPPASRIAKDPLLHEVDVVACPKSMLRDTLSDKVARLRGCPMTVAEYER